MPTSSVSGVLAMVFILAMVWLRTRLRYPRAPRTHLRLTRAGAGYFLVLLALLLLGWSGAPWLMLQLKLSALLTPALVRAAWFLVTYLAFIPLHGALISRGVPVFEATVRSAGSENP
jgi:hypothetical protein